MFQSLKRSWLAVMLLVAGAPSVFGFSLLGPFNEAIGTGGVDWQAPEIGYHLVPGDEGFIDVGGPKALGQVYRYNTPNLYYAFDSTFFDFFGSDGGAAEQIDQAFAILNALTNYSRYPTDLGDLPLDPTRINFSASALNILDVKSLVLTAMVEQLGLTEPERYVWTLHDHFLPAGAVCPNFVYLVIQRNIDPVSQIYSPYINGDLYSYNILEYCGVNPAPFGAVRSVTVPFKVDPVGQNPNATTVADGNINLFPGQFYTSLSRDDVGGLIYLMSTNRVDWEQAAPTNTLLVVSNNSLNLLVTSNFATLASQALTNDPATLQGLYPGLSINTLSNMTFFTNVITTNISAFFTNLPGSVVGAQATLVLVTNFTTNVAQRFLYSFNNVITNHSYTTGYVTTVTTTVGVPPGSVVGSAPSTNTTTVTTLVTNLVNGSYYFFPTNAQCGFSIVATQLVLTTPVTNLIIVATNTPGVTNVNSQQFTQTIITYFTNEFFIASIPQCVPGPTNLIQGVDKLSFFRHDYDSLKGTYWSPITNTYTLTMVTNNGPFVQTFQRVITAPDFLFSAADLASGPNAKISVNAYGRSAPNFTDTAPTTQGPAQAVGPGTLQPRVFFTFNNVGPIFLSLGSFFVQAGGAGITPEVSSGSIFYYGSFDDSTNAPIVYPNTVSLTNLQNQLYLQILLSGPLPTGHVGVPYTSGPLQVSGFQGPFTWSLAPNSSSLPPGLNPPVANATNSAFGSISGTPNSSGIYDFDVQVQDSAGRTTQRNFSIEIDP